MNQPKNNARNDLRHVMTDRRKLLAGASALVGSGAVAVATWGSFSGRTSLAQETNLNPGVATPNPLGPTVPA